MIETYKNKHTGEVVQIDHIEWVKACDSWDKVVVYVLTNGMRWDSNQFLQNHVRETKEGIISNDR